VSAAEDLIAFAAVYCSVECSITVQVSGYWHPRNPSRTQLQSRTVNIQEQVTPLNRDVGGGRDQLISLMVSEYGAVQTISVAPPGDRMVLFYSDSNSIYLLCV